MLGTVAKRLFGSANDRFVKSLRKAVDAINALEPELEALSDAELRARTDRFRERLNEGATLTTCSSRRSPRCAKPRSGLSASAISTCS